jgi:hypothetical protein
MPKGIIRGVFGGLALAVATHNASFVEDLKSMTPNEIADRKVSDNQRKEFADFKKAFDERSGPVFDKAVQECAAARTRHYGGLSNYASKAILSGFGKSTAFNSDLCIKNRILEDNWLVSVRPIPEIGNASEKYKEYMISTHINGVYVAGALGGILALSGVAAFVRGNRKQISPT